MALLVREKRGAGAVSGSGQLRIHRGCHQLRRHEDAGQVGVLGQHVLCGICGHVGGPFGRPLDQRDVRCQLLQSVGKAV